MNNTAKQVGQSARDLAQKIARQMAQEPLEILKTAADQVASPEIPSQGPPPQQSSENQKAQMDQAKAQDNMKSSRRMEALEAELKDIHKQDVFKDLQSRISQGEKIPLEDYVGLSMEQKQVLKAQMEAVEYQKQQAAYNEAQGGGSLFGSAKKGRKMGGGQHGGQKQEAEKQTTRVEKPVPPSG